MRRTLVVLLSLFLPLAAHLRAQTHHAASPAVTPLASAHHSNAGRGDGTLSVYNSGDPTAEEQYMLELINRARRAVLLLRASA